MSEKIQKVLESFVPELLNYKNKEEFSDSEIQKIIKKRRHYESLINGDNSKRSPFHYKKYIEYEKSLFHLRSLRNKISSNDLQLLHITNIYKAYLHFFPKEFLVFREFIDFLLKNNICLKKVAIKWFRLNLNNLEVLYFCINSLVDQFFPQTEKIKEDLKLQELETVRSLCIETTKIHERPECLEKFKAVEMRLGEFFKNLDLLELFIESKELVDLLNKELTGSVITKEA